jgi:hypothetical protein
MLLLEVGDSEEINVRIFSLIAEMVGSADLDSVLLTPFETENATEKILAFALTSPNANVSAKAFSVLCELTAQFESWEDETVDSTDPLFETVFRLLHSKLPDLSRFILFGDKFFENHACALDLVCSILARPGPAPAAVISLTVELAEKVFTHPVNSALHIRFLTLARRIARVPAQFASFCQEAGIRARIIGAFARRREVHACYWGMLHGLATTIRATAALKDESPEWLAFFEGTIEPITRAVAEPFGGTRPAPDEAPPDDDLVFPVGRSQQGQRLPPRPAAAVRPPGADRDEEDEDELEEDNIERRPA